MGCHWPGKCEIYFGKVTRVEIHLVGFEELHRPAPSHSGATPLIGLFLLRFGWQVEPFSLGNVRPAIRENRTERRREPATLRDVLFNNPRPSLWSRPGIHHLDLQSLSISDQVTL